MEQTSPVTDNEGSTAPTLPDLPTDLPTDLSSLSLHDDNNAAATSDPSSIWGSAPSSSAPIAISAPSPYSVTYQPYQRHEGYAADSLADLDPYSPSSSQPWSDQTSLGSGTAATTTPPRPGPTLGSTVTPSSRLELLDDSPSPSPTSSIHPLPSPPPPPIENEAPPIPLKAAKLLGAGTAPASLGFLGGMFRSASGSAPASGSTPALSEATASGSVSAAEEKEGLRAEFNEKVASPSTPRHPTPLASTSNSPAASSLPNPLASLASVFRSATSANSSLPGTPPSSSPPGKGAFLEAAQSKDSRGKEMEKEKGKLKEVEVEAVFDFNKFLEQMRTRSADPIAKYLRSFLKEFSRRPPVSTSDQIRVINDFLDFISAKMRAVEPWKEVLADKDGERAEAEFDMAMEAMEKLVMNRVWHLTFTPALDLSLLPGHVSPTDDLERDHVLSQRIRLFSWIQPCHLDLPVSPTTSPTSPSLSQPMSPSASSNDGDSIGSGEKRKGKEVSPAQKQKQAQGFLEFAQRELVKINQYKAPRDKLICVLNSCKVIFGLMKHVSSDEGADAFVPFLIYIVLKANPEHLVSNIQFIQRFRNPEKLSGEGGYYLSSLSGAISFIETMDASSLSHITQSEFEINVEEAILNLPVDPEEQALRMPRSPAQSPSANLPFRSSTPSDLTAATDTESPHLIQQPGLSFPNATKAFLLRSTDSVERIVSKPIDAIGRIIDQFDAVLPQVSDDHSPTSPHAGPPPLRRNYPTYTGGQHRPPPLNLATPTRGGSPGQPYQGVLGPPPPPPPPPVENPHAGLYVSDRVSASEVTEEIDRQHEEQRLVAIETLQSIFPQLEKEVLEMVLLSNSGDVARTIDSLLDMS